MELVSLLDETQKIALPRTKVHIAYFRGRFTITMPNGQEGKEMDRPQALVFVSSAQGITQHDRLELAQEIHNIFDRSREDTRAYDISRQCWVLP